MLHERLEKIGKAQPKAKIRRDMVKSKEDEAKLEAIPDDDELRWAQTQTYKDMEYLAAATSHQEALTSAQTEAAQCLMIGGMTVGIRAGRCVEWFLLTMAMAMAVAIKPGDEPGPMNFLEFTRHKTWKDRGSAITALSKAIRRMMGVYCFMPGMDKRELFSPTKESWARHLQR